jgi:hypothetical protein
MQIKRILAIFDEVRCESGQTIDLPSRKVAADAVVQDAFAGRYEVDLSPLVKANEGVGREICTNRSGETRSVQLQSFRKPAVIGLNGEQEHGIAMLATAFGNVVREAAGGGKAWISLHTNRAAPGTTLDIPLAHKDALYVRSHYDAFDLTLHDAPLPDQIDSICAYASRGQRVGDFSMDDMKGIEGSPERNSASAQGSQWS